jgi:hypothetical protein
VINDTFVSQRQSVTGQADAALRPLAHRLKITPENSAGKHWLMQQNGSPADLYLSFNPP